MVKIAVRDPRILSCEDGYAKEMEGNVEEGANRNGSCESQHIINTHTHSTRSAIMFAPQKENPFSFIGLCG